MARFFPPILASKQKTKIVGEPIKIYFQPSKFNSWEETKHVQLNLYDVESNTSLLNTNTSLVHKKNSSGQPLYIQSNGTIGTAITAQPYLVSSSTLSLLLFTSDEILSDSNGKYVVIPDAVVPKGKLVKTQIRLSSLELPDESEITPSWITNGLAMGNISEWSSPSVFRVIAEPTLEWVESFSQTNISFPTFYVSTSSEEKVVELKVSLNGEELIKKMSAWAITESFEFKEQNLIGANVFEVSIKTEGEYVKTKSYNFNYSDSGREPTYYVSDYRTDMGSLKLKLVDESRTNVFAYKAPKYPPDTKYVSATDNYEFVRGNTKFYLQNTREENINIEFIYTINYSSETHPSAEIILKYDYVDGSSETHSVGIATSGAQTDITNMPLSDPLKALRYSYLYLEFSDSSAKISASSVRISRTKTTPVGEYILKRASAKTGYEKWETILEFSAETSSTGVWEYYDNSAQSGVVYQYAIVGRDSDGSLSRPGKKVFAMSSAESVWLSTNKYKFLDFIYDTNISGMRIAKREQIVETLGSKYPYVMNSGKISYKTFSLSATLFHQIDINQDTTSGYYYRDTVPELDTQAIEQDIISNLEMQWEKNYIVERETRNAIVDNLTDINPVLLKADGEDNMIVRFTMVNITPRRDLGNVIYTFSAQVSEVMECTVENLKKYNLQNEKVVEINE